ncbi:hypothetical protein Q3G72_002141 [Acer saccharum]|nr:hypothetical protein Q3G72_002141 [Acer saccharum]
MPVRSKCTFLKGANFADHREFLDFMLVVKAILIQDDMELLCLVIWHSWFHHNSFIHNESGLMPCLVESDAHTMVNLTNSDSAHFSEVGLIIKDIRILLGCSANCFIAFIPKSANLAAHVLAKLSLSFDSAKFWREECPPAIAQAVLGDCHP